jgi:hypothetical protein
MNIKELLDILFKPDYTLTLKEQFIKRDYEKR